MNTHDFKIYTTIPDEDINRLDVYEKAVILEFKQREKFFSKLFCKSKDLVRTPVRALAKLLKISVPKIRKCIARLIEIGYLSKLEDAKGNKGAIYCIKDFTHKVIDYAKQKKDERATREHSCVKQDCTQVQASVQRNFTHSLYKNKNKYKNNNGSLELMAEKVYQSIIQKSHYFDGEYSIEEKKVLNTIPGGRWGICTSTAFQKPKIIEQIVSALS